jgi:hypothetical protein
MYYFAIGQLLGIADIYCAVETRRYSPVSHLASAFRIKRRFFDQKINLITIPCFFHQFPVLNQGQNPGFQALHVIAPE